MVLSRGVALNAHFLIEDRKGIEPTEANRNLATWSGAYKDAGIP